jgi:hypothetical protein
MEYVGIDDGYGHYGELCCDVYVCPACGYEDVGHCEDCTDAHEHITSPEDINRNYKDYE